GPGTRVRDRPGLDGPWALAATLAGLEARRRARVRVRARAPRGGARLRGGRDLARAARRAVALAPRVLGTRRPEHALAARAGARRAPRRSGAVLGPHQRSRRLLRADRGRARRGRGDARASRALPLVPAARPPRPAERGGAGAGAGDRAGGGA